MQTKTSSADMKRPRCSARNITTVAIMAVAATVAAVGVSTMSSASSARAVAKSGPATPFVVYAFTINPSADDSVIPAPGTKGDVVSEGDVSIVNDQLTSTHEIASGYPIIGYVAPVGWTGFAPSIRGSAATPASSLQALIASQDGGK